jgi:hypothetical protein
MRPITKAASDYLNQPTMHNRLLVEGDVIRQFDGSYHYIQYVNSSGAYAVPLSAVNRDIKGAVVAFTAGGRTISARSVVEVIHPLAMGGSSPEYQRYAKMAKASGKRLKVGAMTQEKGISFGDFDKSDMPDLESPDGLAGDDLETAPGGQVDMAKKAKNGKAKTAKARVPKAPKQLRNCACGCGTETSGYFAPGHDAKLHGWIAKLSDGRMEPKDIPATTRAKLNLVKTKDGYKATTPSFYKD